MECPMGSILHPMRYMMQWDAPWHVPCDPWDVPQVRMGHPMAYPMGPIQLGGTSHGMSHGLHWPMGSPVDTPMYSIVSMGDPMGQ